VSRVAAYARVANVSAARVGNTMVSAVSAVTVRADQQLLPHRAFLRAAEFLLTLSRIAGDLSET
jgi:hypothetical protein